ncbi:type II secretion system protein [Candidatus Woesebacteria bacterium]|nr:type II secretion system protein [Candidatus Woesebacteria bacterium]
MKGFTLIELLIVISILGVLATLFLLNFPGARSSARDTQRKNDLRQYQTFLEKYANLNAGFYPARNVATRVATTLCTDLGVAAGGCPEEPKNLNFYFYISDSGNTGNATATRFVLWGRLEKPPSNPPYFIVCSNGATGQSPTQPSSSICPI